MLFRVLVLIVGWLAAAVRSSSARRDFEGMEQRRKRAARMFERGVTPG